MGVTEVSPAAAAVVFSSGAAGMDTGRVAAELAAAEAAVYQIAQSVARARA